LNHASEFSGDEKELVWLDTSENFFDYTRFAGEGNIGHIFEINKKKWLLPIITPK
jgi:8-oxo-dGTP diphosphatase